MCAQCSSVNSMLVTWVTGPAGSHAWSTVLVPVGQHGTGWSSPSGDGGSSTKRAARKSVLRHRRVPRARRSGSTPTRPLTQAPVRQEPVHDPWGIQMLHLDAAPVVAPFAWLPPHESVPQVSGGKLLTRASAGSWVPLCHTGCRHETAKTYG
jgi:hypothetical protein